MTLDQKKLVPERDEHLQKGEFSVLKGEYTKNFNVYVVGSQHKEAVEYILMLLDRSTDNALNFGIKMGTGKKYGVTFWEEEDIPEEYRAQ